LVPVDGEHLPDETTAGVAAHEESVPDATTQHRASLSSTSSFHSVEGELIHIKTGPTAKPANPDANWLVVLGEG
jgi:hypothetical protein